MNYDDPIKVLPRIGEKREKVFAENGIVNVMDLLHFFPKKYQDHNQRGSLSDASEGEVTIKVTVVKKGTARRFAKNRSLFVLPVEEIQSNGKILRGEMLWFNSPWLKDVFEIDNEYFFYGRVFHKNGKRQMYNPQWVKADQADAFFQLIPVYKKIDGIPAESIKKWIHLLLDEKMSMPDDLPKKIREAYHLPLQSEIFEKLHRPRNMNDVMIGQQRIKFNTALKINTGILYHRMIQETASHITVNDFTCLKRFENDLPFELTTGQQQVLADIIQDLKTGKTVNRLVQGDVGSGKTVIAAACAFLMALSGYQTAYMAPTEILAQQHAETFKNFLDRYGIKVILITGSMKAKQKKEALEKIASNDAQVIIGTHALIQDKTDYYNLGMVITDEQHRFGVKQRGLLSQKGDAPHTLVMSATPIPRTLSLVYYGDLDLSVIDVLPAGRKKIKTYFYGEKALDKILRFSEEQMSKGFQAIVVCPFIDESEEMGDVFDIHRAYETVKRFYGERVTIGILHGNMKEDEKKAVISAFNNKQIQLLVSTVIIEVGIDVPDVSVMIILSAERFGLSQLHQLRGRAGRGRQQAYCFLVSDNRSEKTIERMKVIVNHHNGQEIAEEDFRLRGSGDYFGFRQHGFADEGLLNPYDDLPLIEQTRTTAEAILRATDRETMLFRSKVIDEFEKSYAVIMN